MAAVTTERKSHTGESPNYLCSSTSNSSSISTETLKLMIGKLSKVPKFTIIVFLYKVDLIHD